MKNLLLILFFICAVCSSAICQTHTILRGKVIDSITKGPIDLSTVAVLNVQDSSLISYTITDKNGQFTIRNLPVERPLRLIISNVSFESYRKELLLKNGETKDLSSIFLNHRTLATVTIRGEQSPISVRKDTIEFSAEAFKTRPNAIVEELLKKLPGVQIDADGTIYMNGRPVKKLLIDGKRYFGDDPKIASRNLDAEIIDKVQIYDDRDDDLNQQLSSSQLNKIINLKLKKKYKKSLFGKVYAGAGTESTYEAGSLLNMFRDTLQMSFLGVTNNLNTSSFSNNDLYNYGGFNRGGSESLSNGNLSVGGNNFSSIQTILTTGFNINTDYGKKLKINLNYFFSRVKDIYRTTSNQQQLLGDTILTSNGNTIKNNIKDQHTINGQVLWNPDDNTQVRFTPTLVFTQINYLDTSSTNRFSNFIHDLNDEYNHDTENNDQFGYQHSFIFFKKLNSNAESLTVTNNVSISPNTDKQYLNSLLDSHTIEQLSDTIHQYIQTINKKDLADININFRQQFNKRLAGDVSLYSAYNFTAQQEALFDKNPEDNTYEIFVPSQSSNLNRKYFTQKLRPEITYQLAKLSIIAGTSLEWDDIHNTFIQNGSTLNQHFFYFFPFIRLQNQSFSVSYEPSVNFPLANQLQPVTIIYNPLYSYTGNPTLTPGVIHNFSGSFNKYFTSNQLSFNVFSNFSLSGNPIITAQSINAFGATMSYPVNVSGHPNYNGYLSAYLNKRFRKLGDWQLNFSTSLSGIFTRNEFLINGLTGIQTTNNIGGGEQFAANWKNLIDFTSQYNIKFSTTHFLNVPYNDVNFNTQTLNNKLLLYWPKNVIIESDYNYSYNSELGDGFQKSVNLLNESVALQILKNKQGQIKLSVYDLLNENVNTVKYVYQNVIYSAENQILKRYLLLTLLYKFNSSK
jgi:hypothetical protein